MRIIAFTSLEDDATFHEALGRVAAIARRGPWVVPALDDTTLRGSRAPQRLSSTGRAALAASTCAMSRSTNARSGSLPSSSST